MFIEQLTNIVLASVPSNPVFAQSLMYCCAPSSATVRESTVKMCKFVLVAVVVVGSWYVR